MSNAQGATLPPRNPSKVTGKFCIEPVLDNNANPQWPPTLVNLRGRWDYRWVAGKESMAQFGKMMRDTPIIYGHRIEVDCENRTMRIYDPYGHELAKDAQRLLDNSRAMSSVNSMFYQEGFPDVVTVENATNDQIKEWLWQMRRWVDQDRAQEIPGKGRTELPDIETIEAMRGKIRNEFFNYSFPVDGKDGKGYHHVVE